MHLKAAAQTIGWITLGWAMLEKLVLGAEAGDEWMGLLECDYIWQGKCFRFLSLVGFNRCHARLLYCFL